MRLSVSPLLPSRAIVDLALVRLIWWNGSYLRKSLCSSAGFICDTPSFRAGFIVHLKPRQSGSYSPCIHAHILFTPSLSAETWQVSHRDTWLRSFFPHQLTFAVISIAGTVGLFPGRCGILSVPHRISVLSYSKALIATTQNIDSTDLVHHNSHSHILDQGILSMSTEI